MESPNVESPMGVNPRSNQASKSPSVQVRKTVPHENHDYDTSLHIPSHAEHLETFPSIPAASTMARTRRASASNPKHDTTDSRNQLKKTRTVKEGRQGPLRAKRERSKKTGRLAEVDHERLEVARRVRPRITVDTPHHVEVTAEHKQPEGHEAETAAAEPGGFKLTATPKDPEPSHNTPPRGATNEKRSGSSSRSPPVLAVPRAVAPRAAAAVAAASAAAPAFGARPPVIIVRAADFPGASEFRVPPSVP